MMTLDNSEHFTVKIPDFILLKESQKEVEVLKKEIEALNIEKNKKKSEINKLNSIITGSVIDEDRKIKFEMKCTVKKELIYKKLNEKLNKVTSRAKELKLLNDDIVYKYIQIGRAHV